MDAFIYDHAFKDPAWICRLSINHFIFRFAIGDNRDLHFKRSVPKSFLTLRTPIAMHFSLGYPVTAKGYALLALLLLILWLEISCIAYLL
ncbi:MAG: hypothetical protein Q4E81_01930 [Succinatimonas sp.]|nr:hypothetical protein [Succinatimonas sp.]